MTRNRGTPGDSNGNRVWSDYMTQHDVDVSLTAAKCNNVPRYDYDQCRAMHFNQSYFSASVRM